MTRAFTPNPTSRLPCRDGSKHRLFEVDPQSTVLRTVASGRQHAFTLIEMLVTCAVLVIVMGLMVSLARHVRASSASALTENLLRDLDAIVDQYQAGGSWSGEPVRRPTTTTRPDDASVTGLRALPVVTPLIPDDPSYVADERAIQITARTNNRELVRFLRSLPGAAGAFLGNLPLGTYDDLSLRDSWGTPIVFMTHGQKLIGMSSRGYFFVSAGPDRKFLTRDDNLYSYEGR